MRTGNHQTIYYDIQFALNTKDIKIGGNLSLVIYSLNHESL